MIRLIERTDYFDLVSWYSGHNLPAPSPESLSPTGFILPNMVACFLYETPSSICFIEGLVSSPTLDKALKDQAVIDLIEHVTAWARHRGYKQIYGFSQHDKIANRFQSLGYSLQPGFIGFSKEL